MGRYECHSLGIVAVLVLLVTWNLHGFANRPTRRLQLSVRRQDGGEEDHGVRGVPTAAPTEEAESLAIWLGGTGSSMVEGCPSDCHPQPHADMQGDAVGRSGSANLQPSAAACCAACRDHAAVAQPGTRACNVWVYCGDASACGASYRHCWLKRQPDPFSLPMVGGLGVSWGKLVPWTSGVIGRPPPRLPGAADTPRAGVAAALPPAANASVALVTEQGRLRLVLRPDVSPAVAKWVEGLAAEGSGCVGCRFYRAEPVPVGWGERYFYGPPYALLQGTMAAEGGRRPPPLPKEGGCLLTRGKVIMIDSGPDFLIGLAGHPEWASSYSYFADVAREDLKVIDAILALPLLTQNWGAINATVFADKRGVRFTVERA